MMSAISKPKERMKGRRKKKHCFVGNKMAHTLPDVAMVVLIYLNSGQLYTAQPKQKYNQAKHFIEFV